MNPTELSDADVGLVAAPQGRSTGYVYTGSDQSLPPGQAAVYDELRAAGGLDPHGVPGSARMPKAQTAPQDIPGPGQFYVPVGGGGVRQAPQQEMSDADVGLTEQGDPSQLPVSQSLGFKQGILKAPNNVATWLGDVPRLPSTVRPEELAGSGGADLHSLGTALGGWLSGANADVSRRANTERPGVLGKIGGEILGTLPTMALPGGPLVQGAATGAMLSDHPNDPIAVGRDAALGSAGAWVGGKVIGGVLGRAASPAVRPEAQQLLDQGVRLTPGQITGGWFKRVEDAMTSTPVLGDAIRTAQRRSLSDFNRAGMNDSLSHIGEALPSSVDPGRAGIGYVQSRLGDAYEKVAPQLKADLDPTFVGNVGKLRADIAPRALDHLPTFDHVLQTEILPRMGPTGSLDGQAAKDAQTAIGNHIRELSGSSDPKTRALVDGLQGLRDELDSSLARNSPPEAASKLRDINAGYAKFVRLQNAAAGASEKEGGMFTPFQLSKAVKSGDGTIRKGAFARGDALMQDLSSAGEKVLPSSVPDSGTGLRMLMHEIPMMIGFGAESQHFLPQAAGAMSIAGLAGFPYSATGQFLARKALTSRPWTAAQSQALLAPIRGVLGDVGAVSSQYAPISGLLPAPTP